MPTTTIYPSSATFTSSEWSGSTADMIGPPDSVYATTNLFLGSASATLTFDPVGTGVVPSGAMLMGVEAIVEGYVSAAGEFVMSLSRDAGDFFSNVALDALPMTSPSEIDPDLDALRSGFTTTLGIASIGPFSSETVSIDTIGLALTWTMPLESGVNRRRRWTRHRWGACCILLF